MTKKEILKIVEDAFDNYIYSESFETIHGTSSDIVGKTEMIRSISENLDEKFPNYNNLSDDKIDSLLREIDDYAIGCDKYSFGLPIPHEIESLRALVRTSLNEEK